MKPLNVLRSQFGFSSFRGQQEAVIDCVLAGEHVLLIMPTGMGKSLCFQIPALILSAIQVPSSPDGKRPLTLVISPLIALMKDQVDGLVARGIDATYINSSLSREQRETRYKAIAQGEHMLLYVTPERFRKPEFITALANRHVPLLAVDEAHCISQWGHDFRPDYSRLDEFRELLGFPTTIALTATATPDVQEDIVRQLGLTYDQMRMFHEGINRPNLTLQVEEVWGDEEKLEQIRQVVSIPDFARQSGIVYFTLIKTLVEFSERLTAYDIPHVCYHGDLDRRQRSRIQEEFMRGDAPLVLATNAFGMGIDKEDIRFVIHADVPGSLESYYQEVGRAGRDGLPAICLLLYDQSDLTSHMNFIQWKNPDADFYRRTFDFLTHDREQILAFGLDWLKGKLHARRGHDFRLETTLAMLERHGVIQRQQNESDIVVLSDLPEELVEQAQLDEKVASNQQKLYALVEYARYEGDRKAFIHDYFGLPYEADS